MSQVREMLTDQPQFTLFLLAYYVWTLSAPLAHYFERHRKRD